MAFALFLPAAAGAQGGDPARGAEVALDSERGNCTICHVIPGLPVPVEAQGNIGPSLGGVGLRLTVDEMRDRITDPRVLMGDTIMPAYGTTEGLTDVAAAFRGKAILTPEEITDLVAFLEGLK